MKSVENSGYFQDLFFHAYQNKNVVSFALNFLSTNSVLWSGALTNTSNGRTSIVVILVGSNYFHNPLGVKCINTIKKTQVIILLKMKIAIVELSIFLFKFTFEIQNP